MPKVIPGSSPVDALISLLHSLYADSDGNGKTVRLFLLDFSKAFDRINYKILITKMRKLDINPSVINWVIDFLSGRKQRVKMGNVFSDWSSVNGGVPQGTVLGPILFLIMINDLVTDHDRRWKFVDDTSVSEVINKGEQGKMQSLVNVINTWCTDNDMKLNQSKCKDMIISFAKDRPKLDPIFVNNHELVPVSSVKVLGTYISADMKWNTHISYIVSKASKRLYFLRLLKRAGLDHSSQLAVYTTCIRSVLEYGCQVWNYGASQYLSDDVERVQRRALRIIYPDLSYRKALEVTSLPSLSQRRDELCRSYFIKMTDPTHKLHYLLPDKRSNSLRNNDNFTYIWSYTNRFKNSYIPSSVVSFNTYNNS